MQNFVVVKASRVLQSNLPLAARGIWLVVGTVIGWKFKITLKLEQPLESNLEPTGTNVAGMLPL